MKRISLIATLFVITMFTAWACRNDPAQEAPVPMSNAMASALFQGDTNAIASLLEAGESLNCEQEGRLPITIAAMNGRLELARWLVNRGAAIDVADGQGRSPLMWAALRGHPEVVIFLVEQGANVNATTSLGETPLMGAVAHRHLDIAQELLARGANPLARTNNGRTAFIMARELNDTQMVTLLIQRLGADTIQAIQAGPAGTAGPATDSPSPG